MFKSIVQTILAVFAGCVFALAWPFYFGIWAMIAVAVLAAFEQKKWLSAVEVFFAVTTVAFCGTWYLGFAGAALLAVWNIVQWIAPLKKMLENAG